MKKGRPKSERIYKYTGYSLKKMLPLFPGYYIIDHLSHMKPLSSYDNCTQRQ